MIYGQYRLAVCSHFTAPRQQFSENASIMNMEITRDGFSLDYLIEGQGIPALIIGSVAYYPQTFSQTLKKYFQLIHMNHRGFAKTTKPYHADDYTLDKIIEDIEALRHDLKLEKMILIGHSGHAHMAVAYAKAYPEHVSHLILIGISPLENHQAADEYFQRIATPERKALLAENLKYIDNSFIGRMLCFGPMLWAQYDFDGSSLWSNVHVNEDIVNYLWGEVFRNHDLTHDLKHLKMPIDVILGKYDFFNPPDLWNGILPDENIHVIETAGHTPQLESPVEFDRIMISLKGELPLSLPR